MNTKKNYFRLRKSYFGVSHDNAALPDEDK